jgi:hypothetical protein
MLGISTVAGVWVAALLGQEFGFTKAKTDVFDAEKKAVEDLWVLDFDFRNVRFIPGTIPGEGRKVVWYMVYKITNRTGEPRQFIPRFQLITNPGSPQAGQVVGQDKNPTGLFSRTFSDAILPNVERAVQLREGPERTFHNSASISKPIPPTPKEGAPIERHGVVFWKDVPMGETKKFSIFVTGLSNGYRRIEDPKDNKKEIVLRKTLEIKFSKPGDDQNITYREIKLDNVDWTYR